MPVDTTAVKQMLDDELVSDGNRQIKAAGLRATLQALVDWVGSVAGLPGPAGSKIYSGATAPNNASFVVGDWYINTSTWDMFEKTAAALWSL